MTIAVTVIRKTVSEKTTKYEDVIVNLLVFGCNKFILLVDLSAKSEIYFGMYVWYANWILWLQFCLY